MRQDDANSLLKLSSTGSTGGTVYHPLVVELVQQLHSSSRFNSATYHGCEPVSIFLLPGSHLWYVALVGASCKRGGRRTR
jgi:hypothetical protein